ncbi:hypothetical protein LCGC14_1086010 [marine sediment metagenome]|uniref:Uncharacterized protein n=1 Tax=marine sediment metagenome TaxID=412755 RepID=A0A0F9PWZ8_9ZZZZ
MGYRDPVHPIRTYGKGRFPAVGIEPYVKPSVAMTGTAIAGGVTEAEIVSGGETIILTLSNGQWERNTTAFDAARQAMIDGMDSAQSEGAGWDAEVKANEVVGAVVRTSDSVVTITLTAAASYVVTADETITVVIPAALMEGQLESLGAGTFVVSEGA